MLTVDCGYRPPTALEIGRAALRGVAWHPRPRTRPNIQASLLSGDPFLSYSGLSTIPLGLASLVTQLPRTHRGWFLLSPTWSIDQEARARKMRSRAVLHRMRHPNHALIFLGNTPAEVELLRRHGEAAFFHNKTSVVSEETFRPVEGQIVE